GLTRFGGKKMRTFLVVHGAWGGGWSWKTVRGLLRAAGQEIFTPTLTGLGERSHLANPDIDLNAHIQDIVGVLESEDLRQAILIARSCGGLVIAGVADRAAPRLAQLVYVDAFVPSDGNSVFDLAPPEIRGSWQEQARTLGEGWRIPPMSLPADLTEA